MTVSVVADVHEQRCKVFRLLSADSDVRLDITSLDAGDYLVENRVLVERKSLLDYKASVQSGRLFAQAYKLKQRRSLIPLVVIEHGSAREELDHPRLVGATLSLALSYGVPTLVTSSPGQFAWLLKRIARSTRQRKAAHLRALTSSEPDVRRATDADSSTGDRTTQGTQHPESLQDPRTRQKKS